MSGFDLHIEYEERLARLEADNARLREALRLIYEYVPEGFYSPSDDDDSMNVRAIARTALGQEA